MNTKRGALLLLALLTSAVVGSEVTIVRAVILRKETVLRLENRISPSRTGSNAMACTAE